MKIMPTGEDVRTLSRELKKPCLIPLIWTESGCKNPAETYLGMREKYRPSYLLESLTGPKEESRYSIIGCQSLLHIMIKDREIEINGTRNAVMASRKNLGNILENTDELDILKKGMLFDKIQFLAFNMPRYTLGVTGYLSYDYIHSKIKQITSIKKQSKTPILEFMLPKLAIIFDHHEKETYYASLLLITEENDIRKLYSEKVEELYKFAKNITRYSKKTRETREINYNITKNNFESKIRRIKRYIQSGDVIQTVLSRRMDISPTPNLELFYSELRKINPSPYMFFLDFPGHSIIGSSPESLVRVKGRKVLTRPIAGTRRRGENREDDLNMENELLEDSKERSEHVMLVDLGRNDIGSISKFGTIEIPEFMRVEKYGDVQHIVSTVTGELKDNMSAFEALRAVFPAGTVTGAPKVRAMEIIDELEPTSRGIYSGAVGSFSYTGDADFAIAIRTLIADDEKAQIQVGAGIVADSIPQNEYYETEYKARSLLRAVGVKNEDSSD